MNQRILGLLMSSVVLTACNYDPMQPQTQQPAQPQQPRAAAPAADPVPAERRGAWALPQAVRTCDVAQGVSGSINWNYSDTPGIVKVLINIPDDRGAGEVRFAEGTAIGSKTTGPWLRPGLKFIVRNAADNGELDTVELATAPCP